MYKVLNILLAFLFSLTIISCGDDKEEYSENSVTSTTTNDDTNNDTDNTTTTTDDTTAPVLEEVTSVSTPTTDTTPDYTFSSTEYGTITYGGSCSSSTTTAGFVWDVGSVTTTITFDALTAEDVVHTDLVAKTSVGTYDNCTITVTDPAGNASNPLTVSKFHIYALDYSCNVNNELDGKRSSAAFIAVGDSGSVVRSTDSGASWSKIAESNTGVPQNSNYNIKGIAYGGDHVYAGHGPDANGLIRNNSWIFYASSDNVSSPGGLDVDAVYNACRTYLMAGKSGSVNVMLRSSDGTTWDNSSRVNGSVNNIGMGNRVFMAVGDNGTTGYRSVDNGTTWTNVTLPSGGSYKGVTFGNLTFVAVSETTSSTAVVARSTDSGASWDSTTISSPGLYGVTFGNDIFVAVGDNGTIVRSADNGSSWDNVTSPTKNDLLSVGFGNNSFVAVGKSGNIIRSADNGSSWDNVTSNTTENLNSISY